MSNTQKHVLHVQDRIEMGKKASKMRKSGQIPANIFGEGSPSLAVSMSKSSAIKFLNTAGESGLVYLSLESQKKEIPVLIEEIQHNGLTGDPLHISFKRVNLKEKVQAEVPVEIIGEVNIPDANIILTQDTLEVEALPADLPEKITVDISGLTEVGQSLHLADAQYDREKVMVILTEEELEAPLVIVQEVKEEVEVAPEETTEGETPVADTAQSEGETAAE